MQFEQKFCGEFCTKPGDEVEVATKENICSIVQQSLDKIIAKEDYKNYNITIKVLATEGGNYLGDLYEIDVNGHTKNGSKITSLFIKHIPNDDLITTTVSLNICYSNEFFFYNELSDVINELYVEAGVPEREKLKIVKYYSESSTHALILENLNRKGYETVHRTRQISLSFATSAIKELAKFHGISFILKSKRNDFFEKQIVTLKSPVNFEKTEDASPSNAWKELFNKFINVTFDQIEIEFENAEEKKEKLCNKLYEIMTTNQNVENDSVKCMCHGDFKQGNLLMKENDNGEIETITIDFQLLNYGNPIYDIFYFIFLGTDSKFRKEHMEYLKDIYHDTLTDFLRYFDLDINSFYPRDVFEKDFKDKFEYGLLVSGFFLPFVLIEDPDFIKNGSNDKSPLMHHSFKERINGAFEEYAELGLL